MLRRVLWMAPVLFFIVLATFALMHSIPGGPWDTTSRPISPLLREQLEAKYGLGEPVWRQFLTYSWNMLQGDLGISFQNQDRAVTDVIGERLQVSLVLGLLAMACALVCGVTMGIASAINQNRLLDRIVTTLAVTLASTPSFVLGILMVVVFAVKLGWLPVYGWQQTWWWLPDWRQAILPTVTLGALPTAYLARVTRAAALDVLRQDYIRTAEAKGLPRSVIIRRHLLPNTLIPVLTVAGPIAASLVTGSFIVESVFAIPGLGDQFITSVFRRDYGMIMGLTIFFALVISLANLAVDLLYAVVDPRLRNER